MAWIYLIAAGILETLWAVAMKASNGFTLLIPSLITVLAMIGSVALLALAMRQPCSRATDNSGVQPAELCGSSSVLRGSL